MNVVDVARIHMEITMTTKKAACDNAGGPTDLSPMMIWQNEANEVSLMLVDAKGTTTDYMPKALNLVAQQSMKFLCFVSESFGISLGSTEELDKFMETNRPGSLRAKFSDTGPLSGVNELISLNCINIESGEQAQAIVKFTYDDRGQPVFDEMSADFIPEQHIDKANVSMMFSQFHKFMVAKTN